MGLAWFGAVIEEGDPFRDLATLVRFGRSAASRPSAQLIAARTPSRCGGATPNVGLWCVSLPQTAHAAASIQRIFEWAKDARLEVIEVAASPTGPGGEHRVNLESTQTPAGRVGVGVGWTVVLPNGRHYGALREVTVAVERHIHPAKLHAVRGAVSEIAENEVARELNALTNWVTSEGTAIRHFTEIEFYGVLASDLNGARNSVLILAPFLGHRLGQLIPTLIAARARGVTVTILVRPQYATKTRTRQYLDPLRVAGVEIVERTNRMHEKVVVVDQQLAYHGSLNPLSHKYTTESMMRFTCPPIAESLYLLYHPATGQSFAERVSIEILSGGGRMESRTAWGDPPLWWKAGLL